MKKILFLIIMILTSGLYASVHSLPTYYFWSDTTKMDSSISISDSSKVIPDSSTTVKVKAETRIVYSEPYLDSPLPGSVLSSSAIYSMDYRYTGDILQEMPFGFLQNMGVTGQPSELLLYGLGNGSLSNNVNGIQRNNRWKSSLNLYYIQSELIDSLEIVPLTSGFLYNSQNNPVQINFHTRSGITKRPYSRIRFYQAPEEEGFLDILFNAPVFNKTYVLVQVTNTAIDPLGNRSNPEFNNDFSLWNVETDLRYLVNDDINLVARYNHVKDNVGLFGGVENSSGMYDLNAADFIYSNRRQRITRNDFSLTLNAEFINNSPVTFSAYYQYNLQEYWSNADSSLSNFASINDDNQYKTYGLYGRQILRYGIFDLDLIGNYEHTSYETDLFGDESGENVLSAASRLTLNLFNTFSPSFFIKTANYRKVQFNGFGAETNIDLGRSFSLLGGISFVEKPFSLIENKLLGQNVGISKQKLNLMEVKAAYSSSSINGSAGYFYYKNDNMPLPVISDYSDSLVKNEISTFETEPVERSGFNIDLSVRIWKLLFSNNASYYLDNNTNKFNSLPRFTLSGGVYYIDTLFNNNLYLKAGLNYRLTGEKAFVAYDFEKSLPVYYQSASDASGINPVGADTVPFSKQLDIFVAGTIQKHAIVYIVYENLLSENYYVLPYYPIYRQGFRVGVSWEFLD